MGIIYFVSCRDCKVTRDLDKFYAMRAATDRAEVINIAEEIEAQHGFRAALLASFMWEHKGHNCTVFSERDEALSDELNPFDNQHGMQADKDYWHVNPRSSSVVLDERSGVRAARQPTVGSFDPHNVSGGRTETLTVAGLVHVLRRCPGDLPVIATWEGTWQDVRPEDITVEVDEQNGEPHVLIDVN